MKFRKKSYLKLLYRCKHPIYLMKRCQYYFFGGIYADTSRCHSFSSYCISGYAKNEKGPCKDKKEKKKIGHLLGGLNAY